MNERYKFRAWLKKEKKMVEVVSINFNDKVIAYNDNEKQELCINCSFEDVELMQYTGLKDKNGVEIFESDIVRVYKEKSDSWDSWFEPTDKYKVINFKDGCFRFGCIEFDRYHMCQYELETIGNIYDELLEENNA